MALPGRGCRQQRIRRIRRQQRLEQRQWWAIKGSCTGVQVGAYSVKGNADQMKDKLKAAGFDAIIVSA